MANHFVWGLALGILLALFFWISGIVKRGELRREVRRLREHLHTQMDITAKGNAAMKAELDALKTQNENLRVAVKEWQTKPGRGELRTLAVYDRAIRIMNQNAPGFSAAWERAVEKSEEEVSAVDSGASVSGLFKRAFSPFAALGYNPKTDKPDASGASAHEEGPNGERTPPAHD